MALIYCRDCGRMISDNAGVCPYCGSPLNMRQPVPPAPGFDDYEPKSKNSFWVYALSALIGVLLFALIYLLFSTFVPQCSRSSGKANVASEKTESKEHKSSIDLKRSGFYHLTGRVAGQRCTMDITVAGNDVYGSYYYNKYGSPLSLNGFITGHSLYLYETDEYGTATGVLIGRIHDNKYSGTHTRYSTNVDTHFSFKAR